jgi:hypothetical protein
VSACRSSGAPIRWATTINGKRMPVDDEPVSDGTLVLSDPAPDAYAPVALVIDPDAPTLDDPPRFRPHWATCPHANEHRKLR